MTNCCKPNTLNFLFIKLISVPLPGAAWLEPKGSRAEKAQGAFFGRFGKGLFAGHSVSVFCGGAVPGCEAGFQSMTCGFALVTRGCFWYD